MAVANNYHPDARLCDKYANGRTFFFWDIGTVWEDKLGFPANIVRTSRTDQSNILSLSAGITGYNGYLHWGRSAKSTWKQGQEQLV